MSFSSFFVQEADLEIQQLCHSFLWLADIYMFVDHFSDATLEAAIGHPVSVYEENIKKIQQCAEVISQAPSFLSTSNKLFTVDCTDMKRRLGSCLLTQLDLDDLEGFSC